jgi:hypothetical protein
MGYTIVDIHLQQIQVSVICKSTYLCGYITLNVHSTLSISMKYKDME